MTPRTTPHTTSGSPGKHESADSVRILDPQFSPFQSENPHSDPPTRDSRGFSRLSVASGQTQCRAVTRSDSLCFKSGYAHKSAHRAGPGWRCPRCGCPSTEWNKTFGIWQCIKCQKPAPRPDSAVCAASDWIDPGNEVGNGLPSPGGDPSRHFHGKRDAGGEVKAERSEAQALPLKPLVCDRASTSGDVEGNRVAAHIVSRREGI